MNRNEARALREERVGIAHKMNELATGGLKTPEDRTKFDAYDAEQKELKARIDRIEAATGIEEELRASGAPPQGQPGGVDDPQGAEKFKKAFRSYLKYGSKEEGGAVGRMDPEDRKLILARRDATRVEVRDMGTGGQGAYPGITTGAGIFVPVGFIKDVEEALKYYGPMLKGGLGMPEIMPTDSGQPLPHPTDNDTTVSGELVGEGQQVTTADVTIGMITLGAYKFSTKMVKVSVELIQDSAFDIEAYLTKKFATRLGRILNTKFTTGVGTTEPFGIVTQATLAGTAVGSVTNDGVGGANTIGSDDLTTLEHSVDPLYRISARYMLHDSTLAALKKVKDKYGRMLLWEPGKGIHDPDTLNGYPYEINNDMAAIQATLSSPQVTRKTLLFGALDKYLIRRVRQLSVMRIEERYIDQGQIAFLGFARYDGNLIDAGTHPVTYLQNVA